MNSDEKSLTRFLPGQIIACEVILTRPGSHWRGDESEVLILLAEKPASGTSVAHKS